jgi:hypothetical protein
VRRWRLPDGGTLAELTGGGVYARLSSQGVIVHVYREMLGGEDDSFSRYTYRVEGPALVCDDTCMTPRGTTVTTRSEIVGLRPLDTDEALTTAQIEAALAPRERKHQAAEDSILQEVRAIEQSLRIEPGGLREAARRVADAMVRHKQEAAGALLAVVEKWSRLEKALDSGAKAALQEAAPPLESACRIATLFQWPDPPAPGPEGASTLDPDLRQRLQRHGERAASRLLLELIHAWSNARAALLAAAKEHRGALGAWRQYPRAEKALGRMEAALARTALLVAEAGDTDAIWVQQRRWEASVEARSRNPVAPGPDGDALVADILQCLRACDSSVLPAECKVRWIDALQRLAKHGSGLGSYAAAAAEALLERLDDRASYLTATYDGMTEYVDEHAADALAAVGGPAVPLLIRALETPTPRTRALAARALGGVGAAAHGALDCLERLAGDPAQDVRTAVGVALARLRRLDGCCGVGPKA